MAKIPTDVLVVGNGCRESAICHALLTDPEHPELRVHTLCHPHFPHLLHPLTDGQRSRLINHSEPDSSVPIAIAEWCAIEGIQLVIPGPEAPLVAGLADALQAFDIPCFGPTQTCARLESSKAYAKEMLRKHGVAVPNATEFLPEQIEQMLQAIRMWVMSKRPTYVLKANGLAGGKGVIVPATIEEAQHGMMQLLEMVQDCTGDDRKILFEDRCYGEECSLIGFCNGKQIVFGPQAQDYKRLDDGDRGPNTGGMGAVCPVSVLSDQEVQELTEKLTPLVAELGYIGFLYVALMRSEPGGGVPLVIELNCRLGDPEAQVLLPALSNGFLSVVLGTKPPTWDPAHRHMAVVVASPDYCRPKTHGLPKTHSQTQWPELARPPGITIHPGKPSGRMLTIVVSDRTPKASWVSLRTRLYRSIAHPLALGNGDPPFYRRDIGLRHAIAESRSIRTTRGWTKPLRIAAMCSGHGTSLRAFLDKLPDNPDCPGNVELVVTNTTSSSVETLPQEYGISTIFVPNKEQHRLVGLFRTYAIDAVFLIGYNAIIKPDLIAEYKDKLINVHPSLLPRHAGSFDRDVHKAVICAGDLHTGCTFHVVTNEVDQGPIIHQRQIAVPHGTTATKLRTRVQEEEGVGLLEVVELLAGGELKYAVDGVGADAVAAHAARAGIEGFCGTWIDDATQQRWGACADGVGTKLTLALREYRRLGRPQSVLDNIAQDLVAMSVNDLMVAGGMPDRFLDYIAVDRSDPQLCKGIIDGVRKACGLAGCDLMGGETAEMRGVYWPRECDLAGFVMGTILVELPNKTRMLPRQPVYALPSSGPHSNGFTLLNSLLQKGAPLDVGELLEPTRIYSELPEILAHPMALGAAHITGGGVHANLQRILPPELRLDLYNAPWLLPKVFKDIQRASGLTHEEMLRVFNCGMGVLVVFEKEMGQEWLDRYGLFPAGTLMPAPETA